MICKTLFSSFAACLLTLATFAQFKIQVNPSTGALTSIIHPDDKNEMNWIFSSNDSLLKWQKPHQDWGLGKYSAEDAGIIDEAWTTPVSSSERDSKHQYVYHTRLIDITVDRSPSGKGFTETYTFRNKTNKTQKISKLDIYTPYNDSYPEALISATNRCNAHIWPGMHASYVNAIRMNGLGPHLGLVFTQGAMSSYSIDNRDRHKDIS